MVVNSVGSVAFSAPEGNYFFVMDLNVHRADSGGAAGEAHSKSFNNSVSNLISSSNPGSIPLSSSTLAQSNLTLNTSFNANPNNSSAIPPSTSVAQNPLFHIPSVPGIPANADITNNLVAPPLYPCSLTTIIINFPPVPPPNPFPHPGFLTSATKYTRSKDSNADPSTSDYNPTEQTDSATSSNEDSTSHPSTSANVASISPEQTPPRRPSLSVPKTRGLNLTTTLSSLSNGTRSAGNLSSTHSAGSQPYPNPISSRPRAAFRGSTSTFIKTSEGLPMSQSLLRTFYSSSSDSTSSSAREEGEERTFGFYTWNKSVTFVQLSPARPSGETLVRLSFAAFPTFVSINQYTASSTLLDVVIGFSTGDLIYFDPFCARYTRLNKGGCISGSAVSKVVWLAPTTTRRDGYFVSSHFDGTVIFWDKDREDWNGFLVEPWPKSTLHPRSSQNNPLSRLNRKKHIKSTSGIEADVRSHDILISGLHDGLPPEKRNRLNPVSHWRVSKKAVTDLAFSPDSKLCAVVSEDGCLRIIDADTANLLDTYFSYFGALLCVCWSSDGRLVFTGGQDDLVTAYSLIEQKVIARCQGHASFVTGLSFDPWFSDDRSCRFASVSEDCKLIFWDLSGASLAKPRSQQAHSIQHLTNSRRPSTNSVTHPSILHFHSTNSTGNVNKSFQYNQADLLDDALSSSTPTGHHGHDTRTRGLHPAPGRNEVAILQPVMVKDIGIDPLSSIGFHRDSVIISSRSGQIFVFGRPTPRSVIRESKK